MYNGLNDIQELLNKRADLSARLKLLPYDGTPEVKVIGQNKYLYVRKRENGRLTSAYVGGYSDDLYNILLRNAAESRALKKELRGIDRKLASLGYSTDELPPVVVQNIEFARANMKGSIYEQAVLEGVATSFPQTEAIIAGGEVNGVTAVDVQKILNLKHAWEFILDRGVMASKTDYYLLCHIARIVNEGFFADGGRLRGVPVTIGGTAYVPPLPDEYNIKEDIEGIVNGSSDDIDKAIELCMYCMKTQAFLDGNKRTAVIFANHYLIAHGGGLIVVPEALVPEFKELLIAYYEGQPVEVLRNFLKEKCLRTF